MIPELARPSLRLVREVPHLITIRACAGLGGRRAVFLPAGGRDCGAARLRIHQIAPRLAAHGWRVTTLPRNLTLAQRQRLIALAGAEVLVMQSARHALNRPHLYPGLPVIYDLDDADFHLDHLAEAVMADMGRAAWVAAGSRYIARAAEGQGGRAEVIWTGTPVSPGPRPPQALRAPVVVWAQTRPQTYLHEAEWVRTVMARLGRLHPNIKLRLHDRCPGDDPGFAAGFAAPGVTVEWRPRMDYDRFLASLDDAAIGLAPLDTGTPFSCGKSFGKVLAYLDRKVPVIATPTGEHSRFFTARTGVLTAHPEEAASRAAALLARPDARAAMACAAFEAFRARLTSEVAAAHMAGLLTRAAHRVA